MPFSGVTTSGRIWRKVPECVLADLTNDLTVQLLKLACRLENRKLKCEKAFVDQLLLCIRVRPAWASALAGILHGVSSELRSV